MVAAPFSLDQHESEKGNPLVPVCPTDIYAIKTLAQSMLKF